LEFDSLVFFRCCYVVLVCTDFLLVICTDVTLKEDENDDILHLDLKIKIESENETILIKVEHRRQSTTLIVQPKNEARNIYYNNNVRRACL